MTITLTTRKLHDLFKPVLGYAANNDWPTLCGVHVKGVDGGLMAEATDRFRLGRQFLKGIEGAEGFEALIHVSAIRRALSTFRIKGPLPGRGEVTIEMSERVPKNSTWGQSVIFTGETGDKWTPVAQFEFGNIEGDFPKLDELFARHFETTRPSVGFNPNYLAQVASSAPNLRMPIAFGLNANPNKAAVFQQDGEDYAFKALLMPTSPPKPEGADI